MENRKRGIPPRNGISVGGASFDRIIRGYQKNQGRVNRVFETPPPPRSLGIAGAVGFEDPAMTDFRAQGTIMGLAGLTAVFGMGTGGTPPVSSPEIGREVVKPLDRGGSDVGSHRARASVIRSVVVAIIPDVNRLIEGSMGSFAGSFSIEPCRSLAEPFGLRRRIGVVKRLAVRTGRLRRSPVVHSRPIDLVVFQEPS